MATKTHDLSVKVGSYEKNGETKGRYKNCGALFTHGDGSMYLLVDRTFNFAGVPDKDGRDSVLVSVFPVKDGDKGGSKPQGPQRQPSPDQIQDDDVPF